MQKQILDEPLAAMIRKLETARRRHQMRRATTALVVSLVFAALLYGCLITLSLVTGESVPAGWLTPIFWMFASVAGLLVAARGTPQLPEIARAADKQFGFAERLSTALELATSGCAERPESLVSKALMNDAARHASQVDIEKFAPLAPQRMRALAFSLAMSLLVAGLASYFAQDQKGLRPGQMKLTSASEAEPTAAHVEKITSLIAADAADRKDPYLAAVARSLSALASELAVGSRKPDDAAAQLASLLDHASHAYGDQAPQWAGGANVSPPKIRETLQQIARTGVFPPDAKQDPVAASGETSSKVGAASEQIAPSNRKSSPQTATAPGQADATMDNAAENEFADGDYQLSPADQVRLDRERQIAERQRLTPPGAGQPVGGAQEAGKGGNLAGEGVQPLGAEALEIAAQRATDELALPASERNTGRTIRMEVLPEARERTASRPDAPLSASDRLARTETTVAREAIPLDRRDLGRRYFGQSDASADCAGVCSGRTAR